MQSLHWSNQCCGSPAARGARRGAWGALAAASRVTPRADLGGEFDLALDIRLLLFCLLGRRDISPPVRRHGARTATCLVAATGPGAKIFSSHVEAGARADFCVLAPPPPILNCLLGRSSARRCSFCRTQYHDRPCSFCRTTRFRLCPIFSETRGSSTSLEQMSSNSAASPPHSRHDGAMRRLRSPATYPLTPLTPKPIAQALAAPRGTSSEKRGPAPRHHLCRGGTHYWWDM